MSSLNLGDSAKVFNDYIEEKLNPNYCKNLFDSENLIDSEKKITCLEKILRVTLDFQKKYNINGSPNSEAEKLFQIAFFVAYIAYAIINGEITIKDIQNAMHLSNLETKDMTEDNYMNTSEARYKILIQFVPLVAYLILAKNALDSYKQNGKELKNIDVINKAIVLYNSTRFKYFFNEVDTEAIEDWFNYFWSYQNKIISKEAIKESSLWLNEVLELETSYTSEADRFKEYANNQGLNLNWCNSVIDSNEEVNWLYAITNCSILFYEKVKKENQDLQVFTCDNATCVVRDASLYAAYLCQTCKSTGKVTDFDLKKAFRTINYAGICDDFFICFSEILTNSEIYKYAYISTYKLLAEYAKIGSPIFPKTGEGEITTYDVLYDTLAVYKNLPFRFNLKISDVISEKSEPNIPIINANINNYAELLGQAYQIALTNNKNYLLPPAAGPDA